MQKSHVFEIFDISEHTIKSAVDYCHIQLELDKEHEVIPLTYPYPVKLYKTGEGVSVDIVLNKMIIYYKAGSLITDQEQYEEKTDIQTIKALLTGQAKSIKDPKTITLLLAKQIKKSDLAHIELIVSNLYRVKNGTQPARYTGKYEDAQMINPVSKVIDDSWLSAMAFRDINKGISKGLVKGEMAKMNPIEKIINQDFSPT